MIRSNVFQWLKLVVSQSTFPIELCEAPSWKTHRELHFFFRIFSITPSRWLSGEFFWADVLDSSKNGPLLLGGGDIMIYTPENSHFEPFKMEVDGSDDFPVSSRWFLGFSDFSPRHNVRCWIATLPWRCLSTQQGAEKIVGFQRGFLSMVRGPYLRLPGCSLRLKVLPGWILIWDTQL